MLVKFLDLKRVNGRFKEAFAPISDNFISDGSYILGDHVEKFEDSFAKYCNTNYCLGVGNGFDALVLIIEGYKALGKLSNGDEIIVPSNTFIASILAISKAGLKPILVEPDATTFNLSINNVEEAISTRSKAIMAVHLYGQLAPIQELQEIADRHSMLLLEDAAQAHGAAFNNKKAGAWGDAAAFSFYPGKNLGAIGDAGAITSNDEDLITVVKKIRNYGSIEKYVHQYKGINSRLDEFQAAFLSIKLKLLDADNEERRLIAELYNNRIKNPLIIKPVHPACRLSSVWHLYVIRCKHRDELQSFLLERGIETLIHYPIPPHKQNAYKEFNGLELLESEYMAKEVLSLPIYPTLGYKDVDYIANTINQFQP